MDEQDYIDDHLADLTDKELLAAGQEAVDDLTKAALTQPGSDWHQACFAATVIYAEELSRRGLRLKEPS